jgi:hypothetical protein
MFINVNFEFVTMNPQELKELKEKQDSFLRHVERDSPVKLLFAMIFSLTLYSIYWMQKTNIILEYHDEDAPESGRALLILVIFPLIWATISLSLLFLFKNNIIVTWLNLIGWLIIMILSLKYVYDFFESFGKMTGSFGLFWYFLFYPGYFSLILLFFKIYVTLPLIICTILTIPAMQEYLNYKFEKVSQRDANARFNQKARVNNGL